MNRVHGRWVSDNVVNVNVNVYVNDNVNVNVCVNTNVDAIVDVNVNVSLVYFILSVVKLL